MASASRKTVLVAVAANATIATVTDLLGGFVQYLKDCVCDHLLVDCPTCDGDEKLYLAAIEIRHGDVYHVCNFSKRRYVKSFPTVEYWLSAVPVLPLLHYAVEKICCAVLPPWFGSFEPEKWRPQRRPVPVGRVVRGASRVERALPQLRNEASAKILDARRAGSHWVESKLFGEPNPLRTRGDVSGRRPAVPAEPASGVEAELKSLREKVAHLSSSQKRGFASRDKKIEALTRTVARLQPGGR